MARQEGQIDLFPGEEGGEEMFVRRTNRGYALDEVVSALQKCIRRGMVDDALYWAYEMIESGFYQYLWRRLCIVASEDVGNADPMAAILINALSQNSELATKKWKRSPEGCIEMQAVLYLARAFKNREADDAWCAMDWTKREEVESRPMPDFAVDGHTQRGKREGKNKALEFAQEGRKLEEGRMRGVNEYEWIWDEYHLGYAP